ncbi:predicted protein [Nematostella vectensis]|uniref:RRM domain-containing protein n=1 Tax=Nematostella vectensis TaxID=45351 RepID=A7S745_NEMVE|nr:polymerase delta-interacting protein 3 [Nematostella vectensis]EDO40433.1 predicted protein [Nematostella vectensis]|eukprot:XP_001632496.1 predicted protein [Nematostella vectensis]
MDRRIGKKKPFHGQTQQRTVGLTTFHLRNRKAAREGSFKKKDLRQNLEKKVGLKSQNRTTKFDAREKILSNRSVEELPKKTSLHMDARRKESRSDIIAKNRSLTLDGESIRITAKQNVPPSRSAQFAGQSIQITAIATKTKSKTTTTPTSRTPTSRNQRETPRSSRRGQNARRKEIKLQVNKPYTPAENIIELSPIRPVTSTPFDRLDTYEVPSTTPQTSTRVTISNLHPAVSRQDIEELFGAIGVLKSCKMLRAGMAEVVYTTKEDAVTAYARYHNRNLDGQPMQCKLSVMPSSAVYTPPSAMPLPPLRPAVPKYQPVVKQEPYIPQIGMPSAKPSRPVVFKVKI